MIRIVVGTPGAGKTCYGVREMSDALLKGKTVATNVRLDAGFARRVARRNPRAWRPGGIKHWTAVYETRIAMLEDSADLRRVYPLDGRESSCLVVVDEAHGLLDSRDYRSEERSEWITWLAQHRKVGLDILFIVQHAEMIDTNVRRLTEWEVRLRDLRKARMYGIPVPIPLTVAHWFWTGGRARVSQRTQIFRPGSAHGLFDTKATLHGVSTAIPADAIVLPRPEQGASLGEGLPDRGEPSPGVMAIDAVQSTENMEGATAGTVAPSRHGAQPAPRRDAA